MGRRYRFLRKEAGARPSVDPEVAYTWRRTVTSRGRVRVGGFIGVVLTGAFASLAVNAAGEAGGWTQLGRQAVLAVVGIAYPFVMTWIILWATDRTVGLQVSPDDEETGLDLSEHGESGYQPVVAAVGVTSDDAMTAPDGPREQG